MTRRMTRNEALELVEGLFDVAPDTEAMNFIEATVFGTDAIRALADVESHLANINDEIDPKSFRIINDTIDDDPSADCVTISIFTEG